MDLDVIEQMVGSTIGTIPKVMPKENVEKLTRMKNWNEHHQGHHVRAAELDQLGGNAGDANYGFVAIIVSTIGSATNHFKLIAHQDRKKEQHRLLHHIENKLHHPVNDIKGKEVAIVLPREGTKGVHHHGSRV